jgi:hypothetical protein
MLFSTSDPHKHADTSDLFRLLRISALTRPSRVEEVKLLFCDDSALSRIDCNECKQMVRLNWLHFKVDICYIEHHALKAKGAPASVIEANLDLFFKGVSVLRQFVAKKGRLSPREIDIVEGVLNEGQLLCYNSPALETQKQGIRHYIDFAFSQDRIDFYFLNPIKNTPFISGVALKILLD